MKERHETSRLLPLSNAWRPSRMAREGWDGYESALTELVTRRGMHGAGRPAGHCARTGGGRRQVARRQSASTRRAMRFPGADTRKEPSITSHCPA
jgi:hypothetical protein